MWAIRLYSFFTPALILAGCGRFLWTKPKRYGLFAGKDIRLSKERGRGIIRGHSFCALSDQNKITVRMKYYLRGRISV